jgi:6-phosphofructokinase 1
MIEMKIKPEDMNVEQLGVCRIISPIDGKTGITLMQENQHVLFKDAVSHPTDKASLLSAQVSMERAGPREKVYFDPVKVRAGIVTCGGLCPGLNAVIRAAVLGLWYAYGVRRIVGFQYGYEGMIAKYGHDIVDLDPHVVDGWQHLGGTKLGSSRGPQDPVECVDCLERLGIDQLYIIGGDGAIRGAQTIVKEITRRKLHISVIAIPKTIDNDLLFIDESFGFQTAAAAAVQALTCAHVEAKGAYNGVGLVKLMGRHSGFIACHAALAMSDVNFVLIPEVPFALDGPQGFLAALKHRLELRQHAVIVVAEGGGQNMLKSSGAKDSSGNNKLEDIGIFLRDRIVAYLKKQKLRSTVKYIDPSYMIRSIPPNSHDGVYCLQLGHDAVHAAMAGKTAMVVGRWHGLNVHVPMRVTTMGRKQVDPDRPLWRSVLESTGQAKWYV